MKDINVKTEVNIAKRKKKVWGGVNKTQIL